MVTWQEIIKHYHIKYYNQITKTTKVLKDNFCITCIDYLKIYNNGKFIYLTNRPDCSEYYASEQLFRNDPYFRHPDIHKSGLILLGNDDSTNFQSHVDSISKKFNLYSPIVFSEKGLDYVEIFCFAGENTQAFQTLFLQHSTLLRLFAEYYKKELYLPMNQMEEESFSLIDLQGEYFYSAPKQTLIVDNESLYSFLTAIGKKEEVKKSSLLSNREREYLKLLLQGYSAKDSAIKLHLSRRTIENRIENLKNKLNCGNKRELFSIAANFESLGLL
jgi:DNA-binding CsgD family transcriptional regulator